MYLLPGKHINKYRRIYNNPTEASLKTGADEKIQHTCRVVLHIVSSLKICTRHLPKQAGWFTQSLENTPIELSQPEMTAKRRVGYNDKMTPTNGTLIINYTGAVTFPKMCALEIVHDNTAVFLVLLKGECH